MLSESSEGGWETAGDAGRGSVGEEFGRRSGWAEAFLGGLRLSFESSGRGAVGGFGLGCGSLWVDLGCIRLW